jgi:hypothetical protein
VIARVVTKRDEARLAVFASAIAASSLLCVVADDIWGKPLFRPATNGSFAFVAAMMALAAVAPWLAWTRKGCAGQLRCADGIVRAGGLEIAARDVTALSIANAARGKSVAITRGKKTVFLEVERAEDAALIADTLSGVREPMNGGTSAQLGRRLLGVPQAVFSIVSVGCAELYYLAAVERFSWRAPVLDTSAKQLFGMGGVACATLATVLLLARWLSSSQAIAMRRSSYDTHVALHQAERPGAFVRNLGRSGGLERGDEGIAAWLARLDALPAEPHAYRGGAMKKDALWETLSDGDASIDARMGAARVLRRRYGEEERALVRVVDDPEVRLRVEAALEELDEAERHLETIGPLFRAR